MTWEGQDLLVVPHGIDETTMLRNLDIHIPSPIAEHYAFPSADSLRPFDKQIVTSSLMTMNRHCYILNSMGTGKTKSAIWAFDYLRSVKRAKRMLVVAPLSTLNFTWAKEFMHTLPFLKVNVLTGDRRRRLKYLDEDADVYIINHDGVKVIQDKLQQRRDIDVICFDEASAYRNARAERSKIAKKLAEGRGYIWAMTGSPTPSSPTDAFGLAKLVTPATAPRSFTAFRTETMMQVSQFKWVPRNDAAQTVANILQPSVRFSLDDITELPPLTVHPPQEVGMGPRQQAVYNQLKEHASVLLKEGQVTAHNGGIVFNKLLQASIGWIYDNDRNIIELDGQPRIDALLDIIEAAERKVIVFSPFKSATMGISKALQKEHVEFAEVTGDTPHGERTEIFNKFQGTAKYRVLNAHPECMSHGLTLTAADTIIWFGPVTKLETFEQANARITRVSQLHKQQVIRLVTTPAERMVYKRLAAKEDLQHNILDLLAELTEGKG